MKEKKVTIKSMKESALFADCFLPYGNTKLLDYTDEQGKDFRYAQFNTRAITDCPFRSAGCEKVCYATKGNHIFPSVKLSRIHSYNMSRKANFSEMIVHTIRTHKLTKRYKEAVMLVRIHESGDFYSLQYLRKWLNVWATFEHDENIVFVFYTKSFPLFLKLSDDEKSLLNRLLKAGRVAMNLSIDDTTSLDQRKAYIKMVSTFPKSNTYKCTEDVEDEEKWCYDNLCDCENCAKCGHCNKAQGKVTVVKIHSASHADMEEYRKNVR